jgi:hypothetical protein
LADKNRPPLFYFNKNKKEANMREKSKTELFIIENYFNMTQSEKYERVKSYLIGSAA